MGKEAIAIYQTFTWADRKADELDQVLAAFSKYFKPKTNEIYERFMFLQRRQRQGESFETFYTDLLRLVESCSCHQNEKRKIIRDQIVMNIITSDTTREKLLTEADRSLERAVDVCRSMEATTTYLTSMSATSPLTKKTDSLTAHAVKSKRPFKCEYCGQVHLPKSCPAWGKACTYCNKLNHTDEVCRKQETKQNDR